MKAYLKYHRMSPRKMRVVADSVRGKSVAEARVILASVPNRAAESLAKVLNSAAASAREQGKTDENRLFIDEIRVDKGITLRRYLPRAFGRATPLNKRTSNVILVLKGDAENTSQESAPAKQETHKQPQAN